jgi:osmotically-inducible protein OsmY
MDQGGLTAPSAEKAHQSKSARSRSDSDRAKAKADKVVGRVKGVSKVVNELKVSPTGN